MASGYASVIIAMVPILVAVLETILPNGERLTLLGWVGTLLGAAGIVTLLGPTLHRAALRGLHAATSATDARNLLGFAILFFAALAFAVASVLSRRFHFTVDTFVATAWQIGAAGLVNLAIATGSGAFRTAVWTRTGVLSIVYLSVFGSIVGLTAYTYLLQHVAVTKVSTYAFVNPIIAVLLGVVTFHERLAPAEIAGMAIILLAVGLVILSRTKSAPPPTDPNLTLRISE